MHIKVRILGLLLLSLLVYAPSVFATSQSFAPTQHQRLITQYIDNTKLVTLAGGTHPAATARNDRGAVSDRLMMNHIYLQLRRSPEQQKALDAFVDSLHDPKSPNFHQWVEPQEFGRRFGIAQADIDSVTNWLRNYGFQVHNVFPNMVVDFSGNAGQIRRAFHTEIHNLEVNGKHHIANMSDPRVPAALASAIVGILSLHDFRPVPTSHRVNPAFTIDASDWWVTPADLYTIYHYPSAYKGTGQTIAIMSESNAYNSTGSTSDWNVFRNTLGIPTSTYTHASLTTVHPAPVAGGPACTDPGINDAAMEAALDIEWSAASAPDAAIVLASCNDGASAGLFIAMQNMLSNGGALPHVISISYGYYEEAYGTSGNAYIASLYQMAVTAGVSVFVSSGDSGADARDQNAGIDTHGINVSGFATTPYNVAVGGTDFGDTFADTNSTYWNNTNTGAFGSAKSYIPEIPWNDSCASQLIAEYVSGSTLTYGTTGFCNNVYPYTFLINNSGGGGGPSGCASGAGTTCAGYPKPSWQSGLLGNPTDSVRDIPDVALFAAAGMWGHAYLLCDSQGASACDSAVTINGLTGWGGIGGTSASAPVWAGIQALVNQRTASRWGNPNTTYYSLAKTQYGTSGSTACDSKSVNPTTNSCIFYDVNGAAGYSTTWPSDMDMPCTPGTPKCYAPSGGYGVLSTSTSSYKPAYASNLGWDFATGIGTANITNLINGWPASSGKAVMTSPTNGSKFAGSSVTFQWTTGTGVTGYSLYIGSTSGAHDIAYVSTASTSATVNSLPMDGRKIYVSLYSKINGAWQYNAYSYLAAGTGTPATMTGPTSGTKLASASQTFTWTAGTGNSSYSLYIGTKSGLHDILYVNVGTATSKLVTGLPTNGGKIYVTLYSLNGNTWKYNSYYYYATGTGTAATMTSPTPNSKLTGTSQLFSWNTGSGISSYSLYVGKTKGAHDLFYANTTATSLTATGLPSNGSTVYVRLYSLNGATWLYKDYTYTATGP